MAKFSIDCTLPPHGATFVQPPNARGTLDIVYSCLAVIVLCTWSVLHLNVPMQITPANKRQKLARTLDRTFTKVKWMAMNVLAPEVPFAQAVTGLVNAYKLRSVFDRFKALDKVPWTVTHVQLANMGRFVIRFDQTQLPGHYKDSEHDEDTRCVVDEYCCNRRWPITFSRYIEYS